MIRPVQRVELLGGEAAAGVDNLHLRAVGRLADAQPHLAARAVVLHRVGQQVHEDLAHAQRVGVGVADGDRRRLADDGDAGARRVAGDEPQRLVGQRVECHPLQLQWQRAGLDPRDVERVVDQRQQVVPGGGDVLQVFIRPGAARCVSLQQLREPEHRAQRRAQLVAHARDEGVLRTAGFFGDGASALVAFELLDVGDVGRGADDPHRPAGGVAVEHGIAAVQPAPGAVGVADAIDELGHAAAGRGEQRRDVPAKSRCVVRMHPLDDRVAGDVDPRPGSDAEQPLRAVVDEFDAAGDGVEDVQHARQHVGHLALKPLRGFERGAHRALVDELAFVVEPQPRFAVAVQRRLPRERRHRAAQFDRRGHLRRQHAQQLAFEVGQPPRRTVDRRQRAERVAVAAEQRRAGVEADVRRVGDERVVREARVDRGVGDLEQLGRREDRVRAERQVARCFRHVEPVVRLEPLAVLVDQRDDGDRHAQALGDERGDVVVRRIGPGVEDLGLAQRLQPPGFVSEQGRTGTAHSVAPGQRGAATSVLHARGVRQRLISRRRGR